MSEGEGGVREGVEREAGWVECGKEEGRETSCPFNKSPKAVRASSRSDASRK